MALIETPDPIYAWLRRHAPLYRNAGSSRHSQITS